MLLGIAADLSAPPSSPTSYREVALYAKVYRHYEVLALCPVNERDSYLSWFRTYGIFDYVDDILPREQAGPLTVEIEGGTKARLTAFNVSHVISLL